MFITSPKRKNGSTVIRLVECFRKEGKVKARIVKTIGQSKDKQVIEYYKKVARKLLDDHKKGIVELSKNSGKISIDLARFLGDGRYNNGFEDIFGSSYSVLGFEGLIRGGKKNKQFNQILKDLVLMRIFDPCSKLRSCRLLSQYFNKELSHKRVLTAMDYISKEEEVLKKRITKSVLKGRKDLDVLLFDVTTLYFESIRETDLQGFGYSKDGKFNEVQVVLAVLSTSGGLPVSYEIFPGNMSETKTFKEVLSRAIKEYGVRKFRVLADRGMFSEDNFSFFEDFKAEGLSLEYVVSCPLRKLPKLIKQKILDLRNYKKGEDGSYYYEFVYKGRCHVVAYSLERRARDYKKRQRVLDKLQALFQKGEIPANRIVKSSGAYRYVSKVRGQVSVNYKQIQEDARWDGLYGLCSNIKTSSPMKLMALYRCLWRIEELFRINKHTLRMRPIFHRIPNRIRAHIVICFLAYVVLRQTEMILQKAGVYFSPQSLIDTLKEVESYIIKDKIRKKEREIYCVPNKLSLEAKRIYQIFKKSFPQKPYLLGKT